MNGTAKIRDKECTMKIAEVCECMRLQRQNIERLNVIRVQQLDEVISIIDYIF